MLREYTLAKNVKNPEVRDKHKNSVVWAADIAETESAREIIQHIAQTISQMRLFTSDQVNINRIADVLFGKLRNFLEKYGRLELGVHKSSFTHKGKNIYTDEQIKKSLPFLFHKDGVHSLLFSKDLAKDEFFDFLDIINNEANHSVEENDIVIPLWEKAFANIRYFVSEDFLEGKISMGAKPLEYEFDPDSLVKGKIELDAEDRKALGEAILSEELAGGREVQIERDLELTEDGMAPLFFALDAEEINKLENMLERNRSITAEEELISLIIEMCYLENRPGPFTDIVEALHQCHNQVLEKENYPLAFHLIQSVIEFKEILKSQGDPRCSVLKTFLDNVAGDESLIKLQKYIAEDQLLAPESLLDYLDILGPKSIPALSHLYENDKRPHFRKKVLEVLKRQGAADIQGLMEVVQDEKPDLAKTIISVLSEVDGKNSIQHLANFVNYRNKDIKAEAIKALGKYVDMTANKILLDFLKDDDVDMRIQVAQSCQHVCEKSLKDYILSTVKSKAFRKKSDEEVQAFLELLGRSQTEQAYQTLRSFLKKARITTSTRVKEMSLNAIAALESLGTSEARVILEEGTRSNNRKIRQACEKSLNNLTHRY